MARKHYDDEFKEGACKLVTQRGLSVNEAARRLNLPDQTLGRWLALRGYKPPAAVRAAEPDSDDPIVLKARIRELEGLLHKSEMSNELLKKATAYFASQNP
jgi:transposase-like protein